MRKRRPPILTAFKLGDTGRKFPEAIESQFGNRDTQIGTSHAAALATLLFPH